MYRFLIYSFISLFALSFSVFAQNIYIDISGNIEINRCETNTYTITVTNNSGNDLSDFVIVARLENFTDLEYVTGTSELNINGGGFASIGNPASSGYSGQCTAPSSPYLIWDIDALNGSAVTLGNGETVSVQFDLISGCETVSASLNTLVDYVNSGSDLCDNTGLLNIMVNPGAVTIKKTPAVISEEVGEDVTWTLTVENTGFGVIKNVVVTDLLGDGLTFVSCTQSGDNTGQTTTWDKDDIAGFASMDPGDIITMDITATVSACEYLDNYADVSFSCDDGTECFNTATDGGTATASVQRIAKTPLIDFSPPDISFDYCDDYQEISFTITNTGDGTAFDVWTIVDFSPLVVSNVSAGATYNNTEKRFELTNPLAPSGTYELTFRLSSPDWCGSFPTGDILWQKLYKDYCDNNFYPPVELSTMNPPNSSSGLSASIGGAGAVIFIGDLITYDITSSYSGSLTCGSGNTSDITVVADIPTGFTIVDTDGGTWNAGNRTVTWTYTPPATLDKDLILDAPGTSDCETYCNTIFSTSVEATGTDCCGCALSSTASETTAIECSEGVTSNKAASPTSVERCTDITYTNTYTFDGSSTLVLSDLEFTENAENQQEYVPASLTVTLDGSDITGSVNLTDNTPGGTLLIDFSGAGNDPLAGLPLVISYDLTATGNTITACGQSTFYSWSDLDIGTTSGSECLGDGVLHEVTQVTVGSPGMSVSISGLGNIIHKCETETVTITLTQTTGYDPKDVKLVLSGLNYYVVDPSSVNCSGDVSPVSCTPTIDGDDYVWTFNDVFDTQNHQAILEFDVQKRCSGGKDLVVTAYYDDACTDDGTIDETCSVSDTESPSLLLSGDLLIEKTPEVYYATENTAEWKIYVTNRGTGTAYNVWVDDVLGAGLLYNNAVVSGASTTVTPNEDHEGGAINGCTIEIATITAGERREITLTADLIDCDDLTNDVSASWGCVSQDCQTEVTDNSEVRIPAANLINSNTISPSGALNACSNPTGYITLRNAGQVTVYDLEITETLPGGMLYESGSTRWRINEGVWNGPNASYDPNPTTSPLVWSSTEIAGLASMEPGDKIEIEFAIITDCDFSGGNISVQTSYENPCGSETNSAVSNFTSSYIEPTISITKTKDDTPIDCNENITWTIEVTNTSGYTIPVIWVEDEMDDAFSYVSSTNEDAYSDGGYHDLVETQKVYWEIKDLPHNTTATMTLTALTDQTPCSSNLDNIARAWWGCGDADGNSATNPETDEGLCLYSTEVSDSRTETREPTVGAFDVSVTDNVDACNDDQTISIVLQNSGRTNAQDIDLVITLPDNLTYNTNTAAGILGTDDSGTPVGIANPDVAGNVLTFYDINENDDAGEDLIEILQADGGNDTYVLEFSVKSSCYVTDDLEIEIYYYDCCGDNQYSTTETQEITANYPELSVTKTPQTTTVDCADDVTWIISVTNSGTGLAQVVRVEDTIGDWLDYVANSFSTTVSGLDPDDFVVISGSTYGWEFNNLAANTTETFSIQATLNPDGSPQSDCSAALRQNSVRAIWGCGTTGDAIDNDPTTTNDYDCENDSWSNTATSTVQMPDLIANNITTSISCDGEDGEFNGSVVVRVRNTGTTSAGPFTVSVTAGTWTGTGTSTTSLPINTNRNITIDASGWDLDCNGCAAYSLVATVDSDDDICECNETNNTLTRNFTPNLPNLKINSITPSCTDDGLLRMRVNIENDGCGNTTSAFIIRLEDDQGNSDQISRSSLNQGANVNIDFDDWPVECEDATVNFSATVDFTDTNCECTDDNTDSYEYTNSLPDLEITNIVPTVTCNDDGDFTGEIEIEITNNGNGNVTNDFNINVDDNEGWDTDIMFQAAGGTLPLETGAGASQTVTITWNGSFTTECDFNTITVTLDDGDDVCECSDAANTDTDSYSLTFPNLEINSVTPSCTDDGEYSIAVVVENSGCATASSVLVRLEDNDGNSDDRTITSITAGATQTATFSSWAVDGDPAVLTFSATVDPDSEICEIDGTDNTASTNENTSNLRVVSVDPVCASDETYNVSITIENDGAANITDDFVVRLADNDGHSSNQNFTNIGGTLSFNAGTQQTIEFSDWVVDCEPATLEFSCTVDYGFNQCESGLDDNEGSETLDIYDLEILSVTPLLTCSGEDNVSATIEVTVRNSGGQTINSDFRISISDGEGWSSQQYYNTDLDGGLPLGIGESEILTFSWTRDFLSLPKICSYSIEAEIEDLNDDFCECSNTNNQLSRNYTVELPDLSVESVNATCLGDGNYEIDVEVRNQGCAAANNVRLRLTDGRGNTLDRFINIGLNSTETITFSPWQTGQSNLYIEFTATLDPLLEICEYARDDNTASEEIQCSNLKLISLQTEKIDGFELYNIKLLIKNTGNSDLNTDFLIQLQDNEGNNRTEWFSDIGGTFPLQGGSSQILRFENWSIDDIYQIKFNTILDPTNEICECNTQDNITNNAIVPTLSEWAVILFIGLLAGIGGWFVWRRT
jgi:uncharacterized repeat protein (TIGR01451 family)